MKKILPIFLLFAACSPSRFLPCPPVANAGDTVPSKILISAEPPAFGHSIDGYCLYKDSVVSGLDGWSYTIILPFIRIRVGEIYIN